ncbi:MAG: hypothetical protein R3324_15075, partial [Halobacteriales archaeon]|nr:hypothetical protein [Halobacteriales archaeon]
GLRVAPATGRCFSGFRSAGKGSVCIQSWRTSVPESGAHCGTGNSLTSAPSETRVSPSRPGQVRM